MRGTQFVCPRPPSPQGLPEASPAHRERVEDIFLGGQRTRRHSNDGYPSHSNSFDAHTWHSGNGNTGASGGSASSATGAHHHSNSAAGDEGNEHRRLHRGWATSGCTCCATCSQGCVSRLIHRSGKWRVGVGAAPYEQRLRAALHALASALPYLACPLSPTCLRCLTPPGGSSGSWFSWFGRAEQPVQTQQAGPLPGVSCCEGAGGGRGGATGPGRGRADGRKRMDAPVTVVWERRALATKQAVHALALHSPFLRSFPVLRI